MRTIFIILLVVLAWSGAQGQRRTIEKRISRDSATGVTTVSYDTIEGISENLVPINNMILIEPLAYLFRLNLKYYHTFGSSIVGGLGADYGWQNGSFNGNESYGFNAEVRFYTSKQPAPHGFYVAPDVSISVAKGVNYNYDFYGYGTTTAAIMTVGALAGWQWFLSDNFVLGFAVGMDDYIHVSGPTDTFTFSTLYGSSITGILPVLRFDIGYGW